jgi:hypothetical protein
VPAARIDQRVAAKKNLRQPLKVRSRGALIGVDFHYGGRCAVDVTGRRRGKSQ